MHRESLYLLYRHETRYSSINALQTTSITIESPATTGRGSFGGHTKKRMCLESRVAIFPTQLHGSIPKCVAQFQAFFVAEPMLLCDEQKTSLHQSWVGSIDAIAFPALH